MRTYFVYILASHSRRLYVGVTRDLPKRVWQHKAGLVAGFSRQYRTRSLVYFEQTTDVHAAIGREKQLKRWPRSRKIWLIERGNAGWLDLSANWYARATPPPFCAVRARTALARRARRPASRAPRRVLRVGE